MPKTLKEAPITTPSAREKLAKGLHWRAIDPDVHLGYRKGVRGGRWLVRWYRGDNAYAQVTLGTADDSFPADGPENLNFRPATAKARAHVRQCRAEERALELGPVLRVKDAIAEYLKMREAREEAQRGKDGLKRDARSRLTKHVLTTSLGDRPLHVLDDEALRHWRQKLPGTLASGTVRRLVNDLKAALNHMARINRSRLPTELLAAIRDGLKADEASRAEARRQVLGDADIRRIISAARDVDATQDWDGDLARLVIVLAATGARFSQIMRMKVADVQTDRGRLMIPVSHKGRGEKRTEHVGVQVGQDVVEALRPAINGRPGPSALLERWRRIQISQTDWKRDRRGPWRSASELTRIWVTIVAKAGLPDDILPYCLRHSSIVRGLRAGLPTRLVAAIHDTSVSMIEKHYSAYVVDAMDDIAARAVVPLVDPSSKVVAIR